MPGPARIKGKDLSFKIGATDYKCDVMEVTLEPEDPEEDDLTFCEVGTGASDWFLRGSARSDYGSTSLWSYLWDNAGDDVEFTLAPYGNATPTTSQPHFEGTVTLTKKPAVGGTAGETFTFEFEFKLTGEPTKVTA